MFETLEDAILPFVVFLLIMCFIVLWEVYPSERTFVASVSKIQKIAWCSVGFDDTRECPPTLDAR